MKTRIGKTARAVGWVLTLLFMVFSAAANTAPFLIGQDTAVPDSARVVDTFGGFVNFSAVEGDFAFLAQGLRLEVVNMQADAVVASLDLPSSVKSGFYADDHLFFTFNGTDYLDWLLTVDVSDPLNPQIAGMTVLSGFLGELHTVRVHGDYAWLSTGPDWNTWSRLIAVDVSNPAAPSQTGFLDITHRDFHVIGDTAYVVEGSASGPDTNRVAILDVSDKSVMARLAQFEAPYARGLDVNDGYLYVAHSSSSNGVKIFDLSDPLNPQLTSTFTHNLDNYQDVIADTGRIYIKRTNTRWVVADVSDKSAPGFLGEYEFDDIFNHDALLGQTLYGRMNGRLALADFTDPADPVISMPFTSPPMTRGMAVSDSRLFAITENQLLVYDLSVPAAPVLMDTLAMQWGNKVFAGEDLLAVANWANDLAFYDISGPSPVKLGEYEAGAMIVRVGFRGDYAYLITFKLSGGSPAQCQLEVIDISDPSAPFMAGSVLYGGVSKDLAVPDTGDVVYIVYDDEENGGGVHVADVSDPAAPVLANTTTMEHDPVSVALADTMLFVGNNHSDDNYGRVTAYSVADPASPRYLFADGFDPDSPVSDMIWMDGTLVVGLPQLGVNTYGYDFETREFDIGPRVHLHLPLLMEGFIPPRVLAKGAFGDVWYVYTMMGHAGHYGPEDYGSYGISIIELWPQPTYTEPTLSIGLASGPSVSLCPPEASEDVTIGSGSIQALKEGWTVNTVIFSAEGQLKADYLMRATLKIAGKIVAGQAVADGLGNLSAISFPVNEHINEGQSLPYQLDYQFYFESKSDTAFLPCPLEEILYCGVSINANQVDAEPDENAPGVKLPVLPTRLYSPQTVIACVWNTVTAPWLPFNGIQEAIDDPLTRDDHEIRVCPGIYRENVDVTKSLSIRSMLGRDYTFVTGVENPDHVFDLKNSGIRVAGFTISDAMGEGLAGVHMDTSALNARIYDNRIRNNPFGILMKGIVNYNGEYEATPFNAEVITNVVTQNSVCGIRMLNAGQSTIWDNDILQNLGPGIEITAGQGADVGCFSNNTIIDNRVSGNVSGIVIFETGQNIIRDNTVTASVNNGIDLDANHSRLGGGNVFIDNVVQGSGGHGLRIHKAGQEVYEQNPMKITGNTFRGNQMNGLFLENVWHFAVHVDSNHFTGNEKYGLELNNIMYIHLEANHLDSNRVGLHMVKCQRNEIFGNTFNDNQEYGVYTQGGLFNEFKKDNKMNRNQIHGFYLYEEEQPRIANLEASYNKSHGVVARGVEKMFMEKSKVESNEGIGVLYKKTYKSFHIWTSQIRYNEKQGVFIDSTRTWYDEDGTVMECDISLNSLSGVEIRKSNFVDVFKCKLSGNEVHGVWSYMSDHIDVTFSKILGNRQVGVYMEDAGYYQSDVKNNKIWYNGTGVKIEDGTVGVFDNDLKKNGDNTGIHLDNAGGTLTGNTIHEDDGNGIACENGSQPEISGNNIFDNTGLGVSNSDASVMVNVSGNWWGDASGPGGEGAGSGDEIGPNIALNHWLAAPVTVTARMAADTVRVPAGEVDTVFCHIQNHHDPAGGVNVHLSDSRGWIAGPADVAAPFQDSLGVRFGVALAVPAGVASGAESWVKIEAASQANATHTAADSFLVITYQQALARIDVEPDSVFLVPGETRPFTVTGYDSLDKVMPAGVRWTCTGGTIDSTGLFTAGADSGRFQVTAEDTLRGLTDVSMVQIGTYTDVKRDPGVSIPTEFALDQNYPNPFNPVTTIGFSVKEPCRVTLIVYDILGREVATLVDENHHPGRYRARFDARRFSTGIYVYRITMKEFTAVRKMIVVK